MQRVKRKQEEALLPPIDSKSQYSFSKFYGSFFHGKAKTPKLDSVLTEDDRVKLKKKKIKISSLADYTPADLSRESGINLEKSRQIIALCQFQSLHGVSIKAALDFWKLGYRDLPQIAKADPKELYRQMIEKSPPQDPCVEDTFRCAVAQCIAITKYNAVLPKQKCQWWNWGGVMRGQDKVSVDKAVRNILEIDEDLDNGKEKKRKIGKS